MVDGSANGEHASLRQRTGRAVVWSAIESWGSKAASMVVFIVLARLLAPTDFGVVASANVVIQLVSVLVVAGFAEAIVQRDTIQSGHVQAAFVISSVFGVALAACVVAVAGPIGSIVGNSEVVPVVRAMSILILIQGIGSTPRALLRRELRFASIAARSVVGSVVGGAAGVIAAVLDAGVWALVVQVLVDATLGTVVVIVAARFVPTGRFTMHELRSLLGYSAGSLGIDIVNFFHRRTDDLAVAVRLGPSALGFYSVGYRFMRLFDDMVSKVLHNVLFPVFARIQTDEKRLGEGYLEVCRISSVFIVPTFAGLSVCAPEIVDTVFGTQWKPAGPVMRALSIAGLAQGIELFSVSVLRARGLVSIVFLHRLVSTLIFVTGFVIAASYGITAVAVTYAVMSVLSTSVPPVLVARDLRFPLSRFLRAISPALVAAGAMVPVTLLVLRAITGAPSTVRLVAAGAVGAITYTVVLWRLMPDVAARTIGRLRESRRAPDPTAEMTGAK